MTMTATIIPFPRTARPALVTAWAPRIGERVIVDIPDMLGGPLHSCVGTVRSGPVMNGWAVEFDCLNGRVVVAYLDEMRPKPKSATS